MSNNAVLYIISASYPFGKGEEFLSKELKELSRYFKKIYLFPLNTDGEQRWIPDNVELVTSLSEVSRSVSILNYIKNLCFIIQVISIEFFNSKIKKAVIAQIRDLVNNLLQVKALSEVFSDKIAPSENNYFYSVWMDDGALLLTILKQKGIIRKFVIRLHGYDLFDERRKGGYMPFQFYIFKYCQKIFVLSKAGYNYILKKNIFSSKLIQNYSGIYDNGINPFDEKAIFTIVSCSNIIKIKRIDKIINSIKLLNFKINWYHFGDGDQMDFIKLKASELPENISCTFTGSVTNAYILDFYRTVSVNLFIHLSDTEGLGMAIVEAQSFGIPALAVDVGGVSEVVNSKTGVLINANDSVQVVAEKIIEIKTGKVNTIEFRKGVKEFWQEKFSAEKNYKYFYDNIIN